MSRSRLCLALLLGLGVFALGACGRDERAASATKPVHIATLNAAYQPLRDTFNRDKGNVRLMFLVDPRCPVCLRGLADMNADLLPALPKNAHVKIYVVYEPALGSHPDDIPAAAALLKTPLVRNYWSPAKDFGMQMSKRLGYKRGNRQIYAWDTWLIYPADALWQDAVPPPPAFLMHQLDGLPHSSRFPFLDVHVFTAKVKTLLAAATRRPPGK